MTNKNRFFWVSNQMLIIVVVAIAAAFRLYDLFHIPYTFDEFSSLGRTGYSSFSELIQKGIIIDAHPAFIQTYWNYYTMFFGTDEWVVKLPFIIMGISAVYLIYGIGKLWLNESAGLFTAAFLRVRSI
jgi:4-amino-4-deoxy-L-arabinose transferase-like glycosyltransferase